MEPQKKSHGNGSLKPWLPRFGNLGSLKPPRLHGTVKSHGDTEKEKQDWSITPPDLKL